jgi:hypothetical protein
MIILILFAITSNTWAKLAYLAERDTGMSRVSAKNIVLTVTHQITGREPRHGHAMPDARSRRFEWALYRPFTGIRISRASAVTL